MEHLGKVESSTRSTPCPCRKKYKLKEVLGTGSYGTVCLAKNRETKETVAI